MAFWGIVLEPKKTYTQHEIDQPFHISMATLDLQNCHPSEDSVAVLCRKQDTDFILCHLSKKHGIYNVPMNLEFELGGEISFHLQGNSSVHLTGYIIEDVESFEESDDSLEEEEDDYKGAHTYLLPVLPEKEAKSSLNNAGAERQPFLDLSFVKNTKKVSDVSGKRKPEERSPDKKSKKVKVEPENDDDDEDDSDFNGGSSGDEDMDDEADLDEEEDDDDDDDDEDEDDEEDEGKVNGKLPISQQLSASSKGKVKQQKQPTAKGNTQPSNNVEKEATKVEQNVKLSKKEKKAQAKNQSNKPETGSQGSKNGHGKQMVQGGVMLEDLVVGTGPVARPGSAVSVYYVGRLKSNNKQFDSTQSGAGFKFRLGRNEVIKGWDVGVVGMKVGGKRRLTIPPKMGYGDKGTGGVIPPGATLVFEVELKNVK